MIISMDGVGESKDKPFLVGKANDAEAVFVETTGLYEGLAKGRQVWVTGDKVDRGIDRGSLIILDGQRQPKPVSKVTREAPTIASTEPWHGVTTPARDEEPEPDPGPTVEEELAAGAATVVTGADDEPPVFNPADYSAKAVIRHIEDHPDEAGAILAAERAGKNRKTIIREFS